MTGSTQRFTTILGISHLFFLLAGYAVLDNATMPVVGDPETVNDTYVEQIVASAKAAIDKARRDGRHRPRARRRRRPQLRRVHDGEPAGALRPVPRRHRPQRRLQPHAHAVRLPERAPHALGGARDLHQGVALHVAHKINEPILLIHGEADNNPGTFPIQSERLYQAIRGNGGTVRYVTLPLESHGYAARESVEHTLYEMISLVRQAREERPAPHEEGRDDGEVSGRE